MQPRHVLISRTDAIGDVVLALPMAGWLRRERPGTRVSFLARAYTRPVVEACEHVDGFFDWDLVSRDTMQAQTEFLRATGADAIVHALPRRAICEAAWRAGIRRRVGSARRLWSLIFSNRHVLDSRKRSGRHEVDLDLSMLKPLGLRSLPSRAEIERLYGLTRVRPLAPERAALLDPERVNVVLHPLSNGNAPEWGLANYARLIELLPAERFRVLVTGSAKERDRIGDRLPLDHPHVENLLGRLDLHELIAVIGRADALVASSTGPLHLAAALGIVAVGVYGAQVSRSAARWGPIGPRAHALTFDPDCPRCRGKDPCDCASRIPPEQVLSLFETHAGARRGAQARAPAERGR